ncbi:MAG: peptide chain release factor-like protein [Pseudomonadota bacterium]|nr:peptide chain release factor-like protein [Pseudomonadota bacterium]
MTRLVVSSGRGPAEVRRFVGWLAAALGGRLGGRIVAWEGAEAAPTSVVLEVTGNAAPWLGTHVLVATLRGRGARRRWFASVCEEPAAPLPVSLGRVRVTAARAGGPGGQNVNRRSTAVRAEAPALGIAVRVADTRSQAQNRRLATARLEDRVAQANAGQVATQRSERWAGHANLERGRPVAAWVLVDERLVPG